MMGMWVKLSNTFVPLKKALYKNLIHGQLILIFFFLMDYIII